MQIPSSHRQLHYVCVVQKNSEKTEKEILQFEPIAQHGALDMSSG